LFLLLLLPILRYGRLGHGGPADELRPRIVKAFEPERMRGKALFAGSTATFVTTRLGDNLFFCGITKKSGEAAMTPRYINDLAGWKTRRVGCGNTSTIVAAEKSIVTWGPSPTSGELGYGEAVKSSTVPKLVPEFEGA
jgi:hypothetical protein